MLPLRCSLSWLAICLSILVAGCAHPDPVSDERDVARRQIAALEDLEQRQEDLADFARGFPEIRDARVYLRGSTAVVILTPAEAGGVPAAVVDSINDRITEDLGIPRERITMKRKEIPGGRR